MAKFIVNAEKQYLAKMRRSYELEVDEEEVIAWANANNCFLGDDDNKSLSSIPKDQLDVMLKHYISDMRLDDCHTCEELDEKEGFYNEGTISALWDIQMKKVDEEVAA